MVLSILKFNLHYFQWVILADSSLWTLLPIGGGAYVFFIALYFIQEQLNSKKTYSYCINLYRNNSPRLISKRGGPRICLIRMRGKFYNHSNLLSVHAPTEVSDEEDKDTFYEFPERTLDPCSGYDTKIIDGDFNTQLGKEAIYQWIIGEHSLHGTTNGNGQRLINFAGSRNLVVGITL